jgi:AcrR family transcriptional regulator
VVARLIPTDRFAAVIDAAARVFVTHGYQRAQIQDVADALRLGKGTLYGYAQSKAALFAAAVRYADGHEPVPSPAALPVPPPGDGELAALVAARLAAEVADLKLAKALTDPPAADTETEFADIVTDLYARLARHRIAIKLVDRCAPELPDLAEVWFGAGRHVHVTAVEQYLMSRQEHGQLRLPGPAPLVARTVVELCTLWAVHSHFDPVPGSRPDDATIAAMLAQLFVRATAST